MTLVKLDTRRIRDWETFHDVFAEVFGFPDFYGRNMNAWIDCMTSLDAPDDGLTTVHAPPGGVLVLQLDHVNDLIERHPDLYDAIVECAAFVNWRRIEVNESAVIALSFHKSAQPNRRA
jgi:hypothetical protein